MRKPPPHPSLARAATHTRGAAHLHAPARERYLAAWRWRRAVEAELRPLALTFTQWLVLEATDDLIREARDAVTQAAVARRTELDPGTTAQVMKTLAKEGLVDRGPDVSGNAYRIIVTQEGRRRLRHAVERVEGVAG